MEGWETPQRTSPKPVYKSNVHRCRHVIRLLNKLICDAEQLVPDTDRPPPDTAYRPYATDYISHDQYNLVLHHLPFLQITDQPQANLQIALDSLTTTDNADVFATSWIKNALLQAKTSQDDSTLGKGWTSVALAMAAFCVGFQTHGNAIKKIATIQVFWDSKGMDQESLDYCISVCIFWVTDVTKHTLVYTSEQVKVCGILITALRAVQCTIANEQEMEVKLTEELIAAQVFAAISLATGYLVATTTMFIPEVYGVQRSLVSLTARLLSSRTATRLFSLSSTYPWAPQRESKQISRLVNYVTHKVTCTVKVFDFDSAAAHFDAPSNLSCLSTLTKRQRYRSPSSTSTDQEEDEMEEIRRTVRRRKRRRRSDTPPRTSSTRTPSRTSANPAMPQRSSPAAAAAAAVKSRPKVLRGQRVTKCPRDSNRPCRGEWYSHKLKRMEQCIYGCLPRTR